MAISAMIVRIFFWGVPKWNLFFLLCNYALCFLCIIIGELLIVYIQYNERAYHGDENELYLHSTLLRCDGLFISE